MEWYKGGRKDDSNDGTGGWRKKLQGVWRGTNNTQKPVLDGGYTTVLNVPNTRGARLAKKLIGCENQLAKLTM